MASQTVLSAPPSLQPEEPSVITELVGLVENTAPKVAKPKVSNHIASKQLTRLNQEIVNLDGSASMGDLFAMAARLAGQAIEAAGEVQSAAREADDMREVLDFWYHLRNFLYVAAFDFRGGNNSVAEALVARRLLEKTSGVSR